MTQTERDYLAGLEKIDHAKKSKVQLNANGADNSPEQRAAVASDSQAIDQRTEKDRIRFAKQLEMIAQSVDYIRRAGSLLKRTGSTQPDYDPGLVKAMKKAEYALQIIGKSNKIMAEDYSNVIDQALFDNESLQPWSEEIRSLGELTQLDRFTLRMGLKK